MNKLYYFILLIFTLSRAEMSVAQPTVAYDFTMNDCNGNMHHLFSELDSGNVVIMELFMLSCSPCVDAGDELEPMFQNLKTTCSNKIIFYHMGYTNSYTCSQITNWVSTNGYSSIPIDSGAVQTAYYGGMGMPTIAVVAGNTHKVLHTSVGYVAGDTAIIADSIRTFFGCGTTNIPQDTGAMTSEIFIYPSPSNGYITISSPMFEVSELEIYNTLGTKVYSAIQSFRYSSVDIFSKPNGIYFLRGKSGEVAFSKKIIVQK